MGILLLVVIYAAFLSLGLPDALLGVSWVEMRAEFNLDIDVAGIISSLTFVFTAISAFFSGQILRRYSTARIVIVSTVLTMLGMIGYSLAPSFWMVLLCTIPLGVGAGAVDTALNNYVALHYEASHMNWLHCFWGIGATVGPAIMAITLDIDVGWRVGYISIASLQLVLVILFIVTKNLWIKGGVTVTETEKKSFFDIMKIKGAKSSVLTIFTYTSAEFTMGLWVSTFLIFSKNLNGSQAGFAVSAYFGGITIARLIIGFFINKLGNQNAINYGIGISFVAALGLLFSSDQTVLYGLSFIIGIGFGPIYPCMVHEMGRFGDDISPVLIGFSSSVASVGILSMPPLVGFLAKSFNINIIPMAIVFFISLCFLCSRLANRSHKNRG